MGRFAPFDRDLVFTDASLAVAAARESGAALMPEVLANRILREHPASGVTTAELAKAIREMADSAGLATDRLPGGAASAGEDRAVGDPPASHPCVQ